MQELDDARAVWLAHTATTRANAEEAEAVLAERHANDAEPEPVVTAVEWLAAHRAAVADDEQHRLVTEDDVVDVPQHADRTERVEAGAVDIREVAAAEPRQTREDVVRVPTAEEVEGPVVRAKRSLAEIRAREAHEHQAEADQRAAELTRWHDNDTAAGHESVDEPVLGYDAGPVPADR